MPSTRSSARLADKPSETQSSNSPPPSTNQLKRKADTTPSSTKSTKEPKTAAKHQQTLQDTLAGNGHHHHHPEDIEMAPSKSNSDPYKSGHDGAPSCWFWLDDQTYTAKDVNETKTFQPGDSFKGTNKQGESKEDPEKALKDCRTGQGLNMLPDEKPQKNMPHDDIHANANSNPNLSIRNSAIQETTERAEAQPSNLLEKGVIYFFTRGRVGIEDPDSVQDLQRSYFVLRPMPPGASIGHGAVEDMKNNRLLALPKKVWPKGPQDKFMVFVERGKTTIADLKDNFFKASDYETKTVGTRHTPAVTPIAEGVYAITKAANGDDSHLSYMVTIPKDPGEMQDDIGIRSKGSFVMSLKNPTVKGPANATLPEGPAFPQEFIDEFRNRSWMPVEPKHLDYENAQILLIGESFDSSHALDATSKDKKADDKETPQEELEKLEGEDESRVKNLRGDDTIFDDLSISKKEYPVVPTTW